MGFKELTCRIYTATCKYLELFNLLWFLFMFIVNLHPPHPNNPFHTQNPHSIIDPQQNKNIFRIYHGAMCCFLNSRYSRLANESNTFKKTSNCGTITSRRLSSAELPMLTFWTFRERTFMFLYFSFKSFEFIYFLWFPEIWHWMFIEISTEKNNKWMMQ